MDIDNNIDKEQNGGASNAGVVVNNGNAGGLGKYGDPNDYYESEQFYEDLRDAARKAKAEDLLLEWKDQAVEKGEDTAFYDKYLADLESFVADNKAKLDDILRDEEEEAKKTS